MESCSRTKSSEALLFVRRSVLGYSTTRTNMDETQAEALRQLAKDVSKAVEARIAGEAGAVELIRRSTQKLQAVGMGPFEYWGVKGGQVFVAKKIYS